MRAAEIGQTHKVFVRHGLKRISCFAPSPEAADDYKRSEPIFSQQMRHPGAGCLAQSSAIQVDVLVVRQTLDFLFQIIRLNANGAADALSA